MADETYRRFHSGRYGSEEVNIEYSTNISGAPPISVKKEDSKKKKEEKEIEGPDVEQGPEMEKAISDIAGKYTK